MMNLEEQVSVYIRTQLTEGSSSGCFTFGPRSVAVPPTPPFTSSPSISIKQKPKITLCASVCSPSSQTEVTWDVAMGDTSGPDPAAADFTITLEKLILERENQIRLLDYWI